MNSLDQRIRNFHSKRGYYQSWLVDENCTARGNNMAKNPDIDKFRSAHRVHLERLGSISLK